MQVFNRHVSGKNGSLDAALCAVWRSGPATAVDHRGLLRIEIDSPNDYWRASTHVAPTLDDAGTSGEAAPDPGVGTATARRAADHV